MNSARTAFIIAAIPFTLMAALWMFLEHALPGSPGTDRGWVFALCGGFYIYGSIHCLRGELPLSLFVFFGLILNVIGAIVWIPALGYRSGNGLGYIGASLALFWMKAIYEAYRDEAR